MEFFLNNHKPDIMHNYCVHNNINNNRFKFLPAHKEIILAIPSQIQKMKIRTEQPENRTASVPPKVPSQNQQKGLKPKRQSKLDTLKSILVTNLREYVQSIGLELKNKRMDNLNIIDFKRCSNKEIPYKCYFSCPFCKDEFLVEYRTRWATANIRRHFRRHSDKEGKSNAGPSCAQPRAETSFTEPELQSKGKSQRSLKSELVTKLKDFVRSIGLELRDESMTDSDVMSFKPCIGSEYLYECHFKSPFCQNPYLVYYRTNWIMGNIRKHLRRHSDREGKSDAGTSSTGPEIDDSWSTDSFDLL